MNKIISSSWFPIIGHGSHPHSVVRLVQFFWRPFVAAFRPDSSVCWPSAGCNLSSAQLVLPHKPPTNQWDCRYLPEPRLMVYTFPEQPLQTVPCRLSSFSHNPPSLFKQLGDTSTVLILLQYYNRYTYTY